jgi:glycosyltransferase involved in cell wall biosynthesis
MTTSILFASEYYPPFAPGGAEWSTAAWAAALIRRGHRVTVVTPNYGAAPREERDGLTIIRVPFPVKLRPGPGEARFSVHRNPLFHLYFAWQVRRAARSAGARIIHAQGKGALVGAWLAGRALGRPVLVTIRDLGLLCPLGHCTVFEPWDRFDCSTAQYLGKCVPYHLAHYAPGLGVLGRARVRAAAIAAWVDNRLRQRILRRVDGVIGVSRGILAVYPTRLLSGSRCRVIPNLPPQVAVPTEAQARLARERLGIGAAAPLVLYAGKLSLGKGTPVLLESLDRIARAVPGVRFVLAGKGAMPIPARPDLQVLGVLPQPDLFALYRASDVIVVPSVWPEPLSRVLLEAMHIGRPVVATSVGGTPEAVEHGVTGLLVPRQDPEALAKAIVELLLDPGRRDRMGRAARARAQGLFDEERLVAALLDAYREATPA